MLHRNPTLHLDKSISFMIFKISVLSPSALQSATDINPKNDSQIFLSSGTRSSFSVSKNYRKLVNFWQVLCSIQNNRQKWSFFNFQNNIFLNLCLSEIMDNVLHIFVYTRRGPRSPGAPYHWYGGNYAPSFSVTISMRSIILVRQNQTSKLIPFFFLHGCKGFTWFIWHNK